MKIRTDKPIGKLISSITQPDGDILEEYEFECMGTICRYFHYAEFMENTELNEPFTGNKIIIN